MFLYQLFSNRYDTEMKKFIVVVLFIIVAVSLAISSWFYSPIALSGEIYLVVEKGDSTAAVANKLQDNNVINKPWLFKMAARIAGLDKKLKTGEYFFSGDVSMQQILDKLTNGDVIYRKITLPEGLTSAQMITIINEEPLLSGEITEEIKEGELLPETYLFVRGEPKNNIVIRAKSAMKEFAAKEWQIKDDVVPVKNINQLIILASIIEKETALDNERGLVASVFVNRLLKGMKLQTDPTVIYALTEGKTDLGRSLSRKDLKIDSPYNTYKYYGLPPTPICNPGKASIAAAANPEYSNYLYFVADGNGGHNFATSLKEHNSNVAEWKRSKK